MFEFRKQNKKKKKKESSINAEINTQFSA